MFESVRMLVRINCAILIAAPAPVNRPGVKTIGSFYLTIDPVASYHKALEKASDLFLFWRNDATSFCHKALQWLPPL